MAIAKDQDLGTNRVDAASTTIVLTTTAAAAANTCIILGAHIYDNPADTLTSVVDNGPGLTWTIDKQDIAGPSPAQMNLALVSAQAPAGLASGTQITLTWAISRNARMVGATSFTGIKSSGTIVDGTPLGPTGAASGTWNSGNYAIAAGSMIVGLGASLTLTGGNTPTSPSLEAWETFDAANNYGCAVVYRIEAAAGSYAVGGTFTGATSSGNIAVAYLEQPASTPGVENRFLIRHSRMTSW